MSNNTFAARVYVTDLEEARQFFGTIMEMVLEDDGTADGYLVFTAPGGQSLLVEKADTTNIETVSHMMDEAEAKIAAIEARANAIADLQEDKLAKAVEKRQQDAQVEKELAELKDQAKAAKEGVARVKLVVDEERKLLPALRTRIGQQNLPKPLDK